MKKLFGWADGYLKECTWKDMALLKFCLGSLGVLAGLQIPQTRRRIAAWTAGLIFIFTYVAVMGKFVLYLLGKHERESLHP